MPISPVTTLPRVVIALALCLVITSVLAARGLVHAGNGMPEGRTRSITLSIGHTLLSFDERTHLTVLWDTAQAAIGRKTQPDAAPLLATAPVVPIPGPILSIDFRGALVAAWSKAHGGHLPAPPPPPPPQIPSVRQITPAAPLRLLVTGDSLTGFLGPELIDEAARIGPVQGSVDTHDGTGLTRPDYVDWSVVAGQQVASDNPDAVVVMIGGNDFQNMTLPNGRFFQAGSPAWTREYQRRAEIVMRIWTRDGTRRVYWLSMPPARDPGWAHTDGQIDIALAHAAADVPGAHYLNILGPITDHGRYTDFVRVNGQPDLVREPDGVHLNVDGSNIVVHEVLPVIVREWHLHH